MSTQAASASESAFSGKTIVVTGVASGIGARTVELLVERGAAVIGLDRKPAAIRLHRSIDVNLADPRSIAAAAASIDGPLDGICNIAGVPPTLEASTVLRVNFLGLRMFTEQLAPKLNPGSSIVCIGSLAGINWRNRLNSLRSFLALRNFDGVAEFCDSHGISDEDCYAFSKEALIAWTFYSSRQWQQNGIRINTISPGPVQTPILADFRSTIGKRFQSVVGSLERPVAVPDEIAAVIIFLLSNESRWIKGANIPVDGGAAAEVIARAMTSNADTV